MAAAPFLDGEQPLHITEERFEFARGAVDGALEFDDPQQRHMTLVSMFLLSEAPERDALFLEVARRLSLQTPNVSRRDDAEEPRRPDAMPTRCAPQVSDRLRAALAVLRAPRRQPRSGS